MAPLVLEGLTLGNRHKHYNNLVNDAIKNNISFETIKDVEEKTDIDKLFKIDLASKARNVDYIIATLKSEDMLHVSRAIKQSPWLIEDKQYAHIINPMYLNDFLFPQMMSRASCKLLLHVRLNLKDEQRVDEFFKYYEAKDNFTALKWLPYCPLDTIEKAVTKYCDDIDCNLFKRLCEKSFTVFEIFNKHFQRYYRKREYIKAVMFLMQTNTEKYLDILENKDPGSYDHHIPKFGYKYTEIVMKKCPERIINKFDLYAHAVDAPTFVKYLGKDKVKEFLLTQAKNPKLKSWFRYDNIKPYVKLMPKEGKFEFLKSIFINKEIKDEGDDDESCDVQEDFAPMSMALKSCQYMSAGVSKKTSHKTVYQWYRHAPFNVAFPEMKKLIRTESSPEERIVIMSVMLTSAGANMNHIQSVLQYYHDRHINEPFKFKIQFVNAVLSTTNTHKYEEKCWKLLDEIFHSCEVYIESDNNVRNCVEAVVLYKVLHDEPIPEIIKTKFTSTSRYTITTFKDKFDKLDNEEKEKLFKYLYERLEKEVNEQTITNEEEFSKVVDLLNQMLRLLIDWKKELLDFYFLLKKIKEIIRLKKEKSYDEDTSSFFETKKSWRKHLFEESLILSPSEEVCINALKHDPELLNRYTSEVDILRFNDSISLTHLLRKLRTYWPQTLGKNWTKLYRERLQQTGGHKAVTRALCTLLPSGDLLEILQKYAPDNNKICWSEADELQLSLQKNFAKNMHIARPQLSPDAVLLYAKGDYLQYALPSLNAIFYNISSTRSREHLPKLINAPVSIQKHGIRLAFAKLRMEEAKELFLNIWKTTKNASIRAVIFYLTHKLLCKEKSSAKLEELWRLLELFIDNLSEDENKSIFALLGDLDPVPDSIKAQYCVKSYKFLKSLPAKADCDQFLGQLLEKVAGLMDKIDPDFVKDILLENNAKIFKQKKSIFEMKSNPQLYAAYIICCETEEIQKQRYEHIFLPLMKLCFSRWEEMQEKRYWIKEFLNSHLDALSQSLTRLLFIKKVVVPVKLFQMIQNELEMGLSVTQSYIYITSWKLKTIFVEIIAGKSLEAFKTKMCDENSDGTCTTGCDPAFESWKQLWAAAVVEFGEKCLQILKEDVNTYFPGIYDLFAESLELMLDNTRLVLDGPVRHELCKVLLTDKDFVQGYLLALKLTPEYCYDKDHKARTIEIRKIIRTSPYLEVKMRYYQAYGMVNDNE